MKWITLGQLSDCLWYSQRVRVRDENGSVLFEGDNYGLQKAYDNHTRWVRGFGSVDDMLIITII